MTTISAQQKYKVIYQKQFYHNVTAENLNTAFYFYNHVDSLITSKINFGFQENFSLITHPIFRISKLFFTNYIITDYLLTMNHELGHGYRMIEAGGSINKIVYNWPPPFSNKFSFITLNRPLRFTEQQELMINLGGSEINLFFSDIMRKNILLNYKFEYNYGLAYLYSSNDMPGYTAFINLEAGDPNRYRKNLNELYSNRGMILTRKKIRKYSFLALFTDPMNFYALKSVFYDYLINGRNTSEIKMISLNNSVKYLPRFRFEYTPFGPELVYQNYFKFKSILFNANLSHSDADLPDAWRIQASVWNLKPHPRLSLDLSGQIWDQPNIKFYQDDKLVEASGLGSQIITSINYDLTKDGHIFGLAVHIGYKSNGYVLGEQLKRGFILRGGFFIQLNDGKTENIRKND